MLKSGKPSKYKTIKIRGEVLWILRSCQREGEPLSDTLQALLDPLRIRDREKEKAQAEKGEK